MIKTASICVLFLFLNGLVAAQDTAYKKKPSEKVLYGIASFYSDHFDGRKTATGEIFRQKGLTAASNNIPLNTWVRVTNLKNKKSVIVRINDRMAPSMARKGRVVDLTRKAAELLSFTGSGLVRVKVEVFGKKKPL